VGIGWNEGSIGIALSLMGLTALLCQTMAGDIVDKTTFDRRYFLVAASIFTAVSASTVLLVREGNVDHMLIYISKVIEGIASSFIGPCLAALTMACFGPDQFDAVMASNILWGHIGSVIAAVLAGGTAYILYPNIKYCFLVIGFSALVAVLFIGYLPQGDTLMGRGFKHIKTEEEESNEQPVENLNVQSTSSNSATPSSQEAARFSLMNSASTAIPDMPEAASYRDVFFEQNTYILCITGFFFQ
jgi:MFS family permease